MDYLKKVCDDARLPKPELIILDLNLPKKDGREVLNEIKTNEYLLRIPVIVLTSSTSAEDVSKAYGEHAIATIAKPVDWTSSPESSRSWKSSGSRRSSCPSRSRT